MATTLKSSRLNLDRHLTDSDSRAEANLRTEDGLRIITSKEVIDAIVKLAEDKWGDDWFVAFVRRYCEIEEFVTGTKPTAKSRRSTLERVFKEGTTNLETASWMAATVGAELQLAVHQVRIVRF